MERIKTLSLDLETYSSIDLAKCGVYKYAESPDFEILLFAYSVNEGPVQVVDIACGEEVPGEILAALTDDTVEKWAYNAQFERVCLSYWLRREYPRYFKGYGVPEDSVGNYLNPASWKCSRIWGAYMGLPLSLKGRRRPYQIFLQALPPHEEERWAHPEPSSPLPGEMGFV